MAVTIKLRRGYLAKWEEVNPILAEGEPGWAIDEYVLKIESDPLYFMPGNDVQEILGLKYPIFVVVYALFIAFYTNLFYIISDFKALKNKKEPK